MKSDKLNSFSVPLGLLDYINPILYSITMVTIIKNTYDIMDSPYNIILLIGAIISITFGFIIPTGKVIVGLGLIKFRMPVSIVACVNTGILLSGLMLLKFVFNLNLKILLAIIIAIILLLLLIFLKRKKINTIAVLAGAFGYLSIYISLITCSVRNNLVIPIILYAFAILLFVILCGIGIKGNLKNPKVHWIIESSNVVCQLLVTLGTVLLFRGILL